VLTDLDRKETSNWLTRAKAKGWLLSAGHGLYKRSKSFPDDFPVEGEPAERRRAPVEDDDKPTRASIQAKLAAAQEGLAKAKRTGEGTLERILTDKVARLQAELDGLEE